MSKKEKIEEQEERLEDATLQDGAEAPTEEPTPEEKIAELEAKIAEL